MPILEISYEGLKPALVEPSLETFLLDKKQIEKNIRERTKAIMPVHLNGRIYNMEEKNCKKHNLKIIKDAVQAHDAIYNGRQA